MPERSHQLAATFACPYCNCLCRFLVELVRDADGWSFKSPKIIVDDHEDDCAMVAWDLAHAE